MITRPSSSLVPASGGMACSAYIAGYRRRRIASVGADMISNTLAMRSSTLTSRVCPRRATDLPAHRAKSGIRRIFSG